MLGFVSGFKIQVNESPFNHGKGFNFDLQAFANIMSFPQFHAWIQANVYFYAESVTSVVCSNSVNFLDSRVMGQGNIGQSLNELW